MQRNLVVLHVATLIHLVLVAILLIYYRVGGVLHVLSICLDVVYVHLLRSVLHVRLDTTCGAPVYVLDVMGL